MSSERLQKILAAAGVASRRKSEELIAAGRVSVNGQVVSQLGAKADPARDHIRVDGRLLRGPERKQYFLLNKPKGYVTTVSDPEGRPTALELLGSVGARLYPVGRLDYLSEGLVLLTNDGALAQKLTHASTHVPKTYLVKVSGKPDESSLQKLRAGIVLPPDTRPTASGQRRRSDGRPVKTAPAKIVLSREADNPWYEVTLIEGRNRQIRRMFEQIGHQVEKIKRIRYGPLELDVEPGQFRPLSTAEIARLTRATGPRTSRDPVVAPPRSPASTAGAGPVRRERRRPSRRPRRES
jgi:23S rRNA pseudouridine2605 synthase